MWRRGTTGQNHTHTHTPTQTSFHILTSTQIYFCPWQDEPSCPHVLPLSRWKGICARWVASSLLKKKKKVIPVSVGVVLADHGIPPAEEAERDKQGRGRAHYSSEDRRWRLFAYAGNNAWITHTHWKLNYILCYTSDVSVMKQKH